MENPRGEFVIQRDLISAELDRIRYATNSIELIIKSLDPGLSEIETLNLPVESQIFIFETHDYLNNHQEKREDFSRMFRKTRLLLFYA
jgi:hypothetical protein